MKRAALSLALAVAAAGCGPSVKSIAVEPPAASLESKGATLQLKAVAKDGKGVPLDPAKVRIAWTSKDPQTATVDEHGTVTAVRSGVTAIAARAAEVAGEASVTVSIAAAVTVNPPSAELRPGDALALTAVVADDTGKALLAPKGVAWTSSDPAIATVADGRVVAAGPGTATVTASFRGLRGTAQVAVKVPVFAKIAVNPAKTQTLKRGDALRFKALALDAKGKPVPGVLATWRSSDSAVASVAADGTVRALKPGKATVTAAAYGKSASVQVKIVEAPSKGKGKPPAKKKK
jgi:uncharacterized protein YjdB